MDLCGQNPVELKKKDDKCHSLLRSHKMNNPHEISMDMLRSVQGIHAPLRIATEMKALRNMGRLPFLPSSNASIDSLTGRDIEFEFADFLNPPEFQETFVHPQRIMDNDI